MSNSYHAETLLIEGPDAMAFAHAQFSSNVLALATGQWQFSAWLDPQGRVKNFFHLARLADDQLLLLLRGGRADDLSELLKRFVFRSKLKLVAFAPRRLLTRSAIPMHLLGDAGVTPSFGCGTHSLQISDDGVGDDDWRAMQQRDGWPWISDTLLGELLASSLSLQRLHAVVIDKGCYPGQEIVARMHFRSGYKKHLYRVGLSRVEKAGETLRMNAQEKGCVIDVVTRAQSIEALVVLNDDFAALAVDEILPASDHGLIMRILERWPA